MPAYQLHAVPSQTLWCLLQCSPFLLLSPLLSSLSLLFLPLLFLPHFILHFSFFAFPFPPFIPSFPSLAFFFILLLDIYNQNDIGQLREGLVDQTAPALVVLNSRTINVREIHQEGLYLLWNHKPWICRISGLEWSFSHFRFFP